MLFVVIFCFFVSGLAFLLAVASYNMAVKSNSALEAYKLVLDSYLKLFNQISINLDQIEANIRKHSQGFVVVDDNFKSIKKCLDDVIGEINKRKEVALPSTDEVKSKLN